MPGAKAKANKQADWHRARQCVYKYKNNPFEPESRLWRYFNKALVHKQMMEALYDDDFEACGCIPKPIVQNEPGSFKGKLK